MIANKKLFIIVLILAFTTFLAYSAFAYGPKSKASQSQKVDPLPVREITKVIPEDYSERSRQGDRRFMHHKHGRGRYRRGRCYHDYDDNRYSRRRRCWSYRYDNDHYIRRRHHRFNDYRSCRQRCNCHYYRRDHRGPRRHHRYRNQPCE